MERHVIDKNKLKGYTYRHSIAFQSGQEGRKSLDLVADTTTNRVSYEITKNGKLHSGTSTLDMAIDLYNKL